MKFLINKVYQWVKKYENGGEEALKDKRGRKKEEAELSPEEKMKLEMKKLERENERLRAENLFLRKLEEIERRRKQTKSVLKTSISQSGNFMRKKT
ncbi:MAG: hypothetical protein C6W54_15845 [Bacillaceae bacterium]|uniref:helix-turn-helix domain-containing protein n=1 Tax=Aeribacillus sp. FSL K6-8394 TaxID=2954570 RepID=UPI000E3A3975|nr:MAG: hypothetical protein C6W54_15845 [Bacillaceae bacterium]